jgi:uncharacterized protein with GYD domain
LYATSIRTGLLFARLPAYWRKLLAELARNPEDRTVAVRELVEGRDSRLIAFYQSSGEYHGAIISEFTDDISGTALSIPAQSAGQLKN